MQFPTKLEFVINLKTAKALGLDLQSTICSVDAFGFKFQWTTNSSKHIPFDWAGP